MAWAAQRRASRPTENEGLLPNEARTSGRYMIVQITISHFLPWLKGTGGHGFAHPEEYNDQKAT